MLVEGNEIYDSTSGIVVKVRNVRIVNNIFHDLVVDPDTWLNSAIFLSHASDVSIVNNTFAALPSHALYIGEGNTVFVQNNLFYDIRQVHWGPTTQLTADYNGWFDAVDRLLGAHDTVGRDPRFLSAGDYHLRGSSPAVDVGGNGAGVPARDFDDNPRPYGPYVDLGAFEVQEPPSVSDLEMSVGVTTTTSVTIRLNWTVPGRVGRPGMAHH